MRPRALPVAFAALALASGARAAPPDEAAAVQALTRGFLEAYLAGDAAAVRRQVAPDAVLFGSDVAERFEGPEGAVRMLALDQRLWGGRARLGSFEGVATSCGGRLCLLTFQAPFSVGERPAVVVRFTLAWRRTPEGWRLVQSANAAPTTGRSAQALLAR